MKQAKARTAALDGRFAALPDDPLFMPGEHPHRPPGIDRLRLDADEPAASAQLAADATQEALVRRPMPVAVRAGERAHQQAPVFFGLELDALQRR